MAEVLKVLSSIISSTVAAIDVRCSELNTAFPSLDDPFSSTTASPQLDNVVSQNITKLVSAAVQLIAVAKPPQNYIFNATCAYYLPIALRVATETHVVEILRESGPNGLHVNEIGEQNGVDPKKLARILRYLAIHHIFKEVKPDVFSLNRHASVIDTGKTLKLIQANPLEKHNGSSGVAALVGHCTDEDLKGAAYIVEHLTDPKSAFSDNPTQSPMMKAFKYEGDVWSWFEEPYNVMRLKRFGCAMKGVSNMQPPEAILKGFDWKSLSPNSLVVDVGGGIGVSIMALAKAFPSLRFVIQDRPAIVKEGIEHWNSYFPEALNSGRVTFQEHDFFQPQTLRQPEVFLLKQISHDWADAYIVHILKQLRAAAAPLPLPEMHDESTTISTLVLIDCIVPYACNVDESFGAISGLPKSSKHPPLLPNFVDADPSIYNTDLSMYVHFNGQERTIHHLYEMLQSAGWGIVRVFAFDDQGYCPQVIARPI